LRYPFRSSQLTCGPVYLQVTSPFSSWKDHGTTITVSPSRIQVLFFILPLIRHILVTLSRHSTLKWLPPSNFTTVPNISPSAFLGVLTRITSPPVSAGFLPCGLCGLYSISPSILYVSLLFKLVTFYILIKIYIIIKIKNECGSN